MTTQIALLRAINVAGQSLVAMADLRAMLANLGFAEPRSLIQSGNLVFQCSSPSGAELERLLERETEQRLGLRTHYLVRTAREWERIVNQNPFPEQAERDPRHLQLMALKAEPTQQAVEALRAAIKGPEIFEVSGTQAYFVYPDGSGRSKLTITAIESKLGTRGTARNWNTVLKLAALVNA